MSTDSPRKANHFDDPQRVRAVVSRAPFAIVDLDDQARIVGWNAAAARMFGYSAAEATQMGPTDLFYRNAAAPEPLDVAALLQDLDRGGSR